MTSSNRTGSGRSSQSRSGPVTVAVVGLGEAGADLHLPALEGLAETRVVALCDPSAERQKWAELRGGAPCFSTLSEALEETAPELVIVATPPDSHHSLCLTAIESGAHLLVEKPFAPSVSEAEEVLAAADRADLVVGLNHEFKEMPILRSVLDHALSGADGVPRFAQLWQLVNRPPGTEAGWRAALTERTLYEAGAHLVDYAMAVFGEQPRAVSASQSAMGTESTDAVMLATLEFSGGRLAQITQSRVSPGDRQYFEARVDLEESSLRASFGGRARVSVGMVRAPKPHMRVELGKSGVAWKEVGSRREYLARNPANPNVEATRTVIAGTVRALRSREVEPPTSGAWGRDVLETITACYRSAETGNRVHLPAASTDLRSVRLGTGENAAL